MEELSGFNGREKFLDCGRRSRKSLDQGRNGSVRVCLWKRAYKAGINLNLVWRHEYKNRRAPMVPKCSMKPSGLPRFNAFNLLEVNERSILGTKYSIKLQKIEGTSQDVA